MILVLVPPTNRPAQLFPYARQVPVVAIVPVKTFSLGKGRLADSLSPLNRERLGQIFAERTVEIAESAGLIPLVVAGDSAVGEWALLNGIPSSPDPGEGLSAAAAEGVAWAGLSSADWMVIHSDLPLLTPGDLEPHLDEIGGGGVLLAPSADGGTSVFGGSGQVNFSYGPGSFSRHFAANPESKVAVSLGLLHDVDSPNDLRSAQIHPRGVWMAGLLQ